MFYGYRYYSATYHVRNEKYKVILETKDYKEVQKILDENPSYTVYATNDLWTK